MFRKSVSRRQSRQREGEGEGEGEPKSETEGEGEVANEETPFGVAPLNLPPPNPLPSLSPLDLRQLHAQRLKRGLSSDRLARVPLPTIGGDAGNGQPRKKRARQDLGSDVRESQIIKTNAFTAPSNTVDVDKHMMAFIQSELEKRQGRQPAIAESAVQSTATAHPSQRPPPEGDLTRSMGMLTAIPEVDLGLDSRLRTIAETEKARREGGGGGGGKGTGRPGGGRSNDHGRPTPPSAPLASSTRWRRERPVASGDGRSSDSRAIERLKKQMLG